MSPRLRHRLWIVLAILTLLCSTAVAQKVLASVNVGYSPWGIAVNPVTKKVYVVNQCNPSQCGASGSLTIIDEQTLATTTLLIGASIQSMPTPIAVNKTTNKIYVATCGSPCSATGIVTVIDGATLAMSNITVGHQPSALAVNEVTNKIYVANACGNGYCGSSNGTLTIIDGATLSTITTGIQFSYYNIYPALAVDSQRNKIYVTNACGTRPDCSSGGTLMVFDGATLANNTVAVGALTNNLALNTATNKIYVTNEGFGGVLTVIDGSTLATQSVSIGGPPVSIATNQVTNKIYVSTYWDYYGTVVVIDGATLSTNPILINGDPASLAVNQITNKIYVPNTLEGYFTVIDGATLSTVNVATSGGPIDAAIDETNNRVYVENYCGVYSGYCVGGPGTVSVVDGTPPTAWQFVPVTPCRVVDTRNPDGTFGGPAISGGTERDFPIPQGACGVPPTAAAYALNITVVPHGRLGYLTIWPTGQPRPLVSTMNSADGRPKANAAIVAGGTNDAVSVYPSDTTDLILDVNGYFVPLPDPEALAFYPVTPCRVADTRNPNGPLGGPYLQGNQQRDFPVLQASGCNIPNTAVAYSMNFTAVPKSTLRYLTVWPSGQQQPVVSTLNDVTGTTVANAAIIPSGANGDISTYVTDNTDLVIDINGYFAPPGQGGLSLYAPAVCRVLDTRSTRGQFNGNLVAGVVSTGCSAPSSAGAFVLNATALPTHQLGYLTLWPDGEPQPLVSTLNAQDGMITSNMAIVPNQNGSLDAFASAYTNLVLDISSYFAP